MWRSGRNMRDVVSGATGRGGILENSGSENSNFPARVERWGGAEFSQIPGLENAHFPYRFPRGKREVGGCRRGGAFGGRRIGYFCQEEAVAECGLERLALGCSMG